ncbi:MAG TPA: penicillin-binding protein 2, partial [Alphaproteobacteria bacterium]|nr:penicillin-binding protein 2 [Alphaproteobacteria bacterium]
MGRASRVRRDLPCLHEGCAGREEALAGRLVVKTPAECTHPVFGGLLLRPVPQKVSAVPEVLARKGRILLAILGVALLLLLGHLWRMQVVQGRGYVERAEDNRLRSIRLAAPRGGMYAADEYPIAVDSPSFEVLVHPGEIPSADRETICTELAGLLGMEPADVIRKVVEGRRWASISLRRGLNLAEAAAVAARESELAGVSVEVHRKRIYPDGDLFGQITGYCGEVTSEELSRPENDYHLRDIIGRAGLEARYESVLRGMDGRRIVVGDARGRVVAEGPVDEPAPGAGLKLSLDPALQRAAADALGEHVGSVVVLEVPTGRVLALVSWPRYDPNTFSENYSTISADPNKPLVFRAISGAYPPGSAMKPFIALAALESGGATGATTYDCPGYVNLGARRIGCWEQWGHGAIPMREAISLSCNVYMIRLGQSLGFDPIYNFATHAGFGRATGIELPGESAGLFPTPYWKRQRYADKPNESGWYPGDTANLCIGQGYLMATPLQVTCAYAALASGGGVVRPHLVDEIVA